MSVDYMLSKVTITGFRGIDSLESPLKPGFPSVLIGANNAGKSTVLNAIALALNGGGSHQWTFSEADFFCDTEGKRSSEFLVQVHFVADTQSGYPAVRGGVGNPIPIQGAQVKGKILKGGKITVVRTLFDSNGDAVTMPLRAPLPKAEKENWTEHNVGYRVVNAKLEDIYEHTPEVWLFNPQNVEASLYIWKTGPLAKLSKLLATKFLSEEWVLKGPNRNWKMPATLRKAHEFFREAVEAFPFWTDDMKPKLETVFSRYIGTHATIDLRPDTLAIEEWLTQQLAISLATDPTSVPTPLKSMGDGWQSMIRLAALEALTEYPDLVRERVVLLLEEPETHLHPHLRRKMRKVAASLAAKGWTIVYTTHSAEMVSFDENQVITRMLRANGSVVSRSVHTDEVDAKAKLQSKMDAHGAHDFLFGTAAIFCEGIRDSFAVRLGLEKMHVDCDALSVSLTPCGSISAIPSFATVATSLGIRWCSLTDQDLQGDGTMNPNTEKVRKTIEQHVGVQDRQCEWPVDLEDCLGITVGKANPEVTLAKLSHPAWETNYPQYKAVVTELATWIVSTS